MTLLMDHPKNIQLIKFFEDQVAKMTISDPDENAKSIINRLQVSSPQKVIILSGGAKFFNENYRNHLTPLFTDGIVKAAVEQQALIIDGGTLSGVMALMGLSVSHYKRQVNLLGVAPLNQVTYPGKEVFHHSLKFNADASHDNIAMLEPNHTHFVLVEADDWGDETDTLINLAKEISINKKPVLVLVNGGLIAKKEVYEAVLQGWSIVIIAGSGRLADEIIEARIKPCKTYDPQLELIVDDGDIHIFSNKGTPKQLRELISKLLE